MLIKINVDLIAVSVWLFIYSAALISLSFGGAIGLMFLMLGCALPIYNQYWPLFVLFFYILSPIPYCIARRLVDDTDAMSNACKELAIFLTTGIVVSAFGLPIVFARANLIEWGACALVLTGNTVIFATILGFFLVFGSNDDFSWQQWWKESLNSRHMDFLSCLGCPCTGDRAVMLSSGAGLSGVFQVLPSHLYCKHTVFTETCWRIKRIFSFGGAWLISHLSLVCFLWCPADFKIFMCFSCSVFFF